MDYLKWLLDQCHISEALIMKYGKLFQYLLEMEFVYVIERDLKRASDGLALRDKFGGFISHIPRACSVLEMLIALAIRVDKEYTGYPGEEHPEIIFFEMFHNLGLGPYTDRNFDHSRHVINSILNRWMYREYNYRGEGSIFVLDEPLQDQREIEIWNQMLDYLNEKGMF